MIDPFDYKRELNEIPSMGWHTVYKGDSAFLAYWHPQYHYFTIGTDNPQDKGRYSIAFFDKIQ